MLAKQKLSEAKRRYSGKDQITLNSKEQIIEPREIETYSSVSQFPVGFDSQKIKIDFDNDAIILPIYGTPVPFHISTIKRLFLFLFFYFLFINFFIYFFIFLFLFLFFLFFIHFSFLFLFFLFFIYFFYYFYF